MVELQKKHQYICKIKSVHDAYCKTVIYQTHVYMTFTDEKLVEKQDRDYQNSIRILSSLQSANKKEDKKICVFKI